MRMIRCTVLFLALATVASAAEVALHLPLGRTAYQTNERIDLTVLRPGPPAELVMDVAGADGSRMRFAFPDARAVEHVHLNGWLLRPGHYTLTASATGARAAVEIDVYSHIRKSSFRLIDWGRAKGKDQLVLGEDSLGFNLIYGHYAKNNEANFMRAGIDFMACCTMSGGHQMDLRSECDWSDPLVVRGGTARVAQRALIDRTRPNVQGVHFYDEPGLTWWKHATTGEWTPHGIPSQIAAYTAAFGRPPIPYHKVDPKNADHVARWKHWATWKLGFMDAAWKDAQFGVSHVRADFLSVTQSQYGWSAYTDGYYFNVARSLPIVSGHGGYHDWGPGYFNPSWFLEVARARDFAKPCWYLPAWYGSTTADEFRLEQYLSFQTNIQGMITPPDIDPFAPSKKPAAQGVVESNQLMARLGTIFTTLPVTRPPVAMLYSMSHLHHAQARDRSVNYAHADDHGLNLVFVYLAGKLLQHQFMAVVDEDVMDGTLAAHHKAVVLASIDHLTPETLEALEAFAAGGGLVLTSDCTVKVKGAIALGVTPGLPDAKLIATLLEEKKTDEANLLMTTGKYLVGARPLAKAISAQLAKAGIAPPMTSDAEGIVVTRQAAGDVEYLFAVNASYDEKAGGRLSLKPVTATLELPNAGSSAYDAVRGGTLPQPRIVASFGPGQMRAIARTARPIGSVSVLAPVLHRDLSQAAAPVAVEVGATVLDAQGGVLSGSIPLYIRLVDPLGATRYELYRATRMGTWTARLPLAANDPTGKWTLVVRELLNNSEGRKAFAYPPMARCGALAGATRRAVCFGRDRDNTHRFARTHQAVTVAVGEGAYNQAAAERLAAAMVPWGMKCTVVPAMSIARPRALTEAEAKTWVGVEFGRAKPGRENNPAKVGFDVRGPVILLGTPKDNPLIAHLVKQRFLPYEPKPGVLPGPGRGYLAWQRDGVGIGQESVTLIADDAEGMAEAVGSFVEAVAGMAPLTPWRMPAGNAVSPATSAPGLLPEPKVAWQFPMPDRVTAMALQGGNLAVRSHDGSVRILDGSGKSLTLKGAGAVVSVEASDAAKAISAKACPADRVVKVVAESAERIAVGCWGGTLLLLDRTGAPKARRQMPQDITAIAWMGDRLVVGLADGRVVALAP